MRYFLLHLFTIVVKHTNSAKPKLPRCLEVNNVAWRKVAPFTEIADHNNRIADYNNSNGIVEKIFNLGMRSCCFGPLTYRHPLTFNSPDDVSNMLIDQNIKSNFDFMLPIQRDPESKTYHIYPYVALVVSPGFAVFVLPSKDGGQAIINSIKGVMPLISIMLILIGIAGILYWMLENMTLAWYGETPERFGPGIINGIWWAVVTMTTVGYGDVVPKTKVGRIFSVLWVFVGLVFCGITISTITTDIIMSITNNEIEIMNQKVAVLRGSEEYRFVVKKQGQPHQYDSVHEIAGALRNRTASIALIETMIAGYHQHMLSEFDLKKIIEHMSGVGVVFINNGSKFAQCIRNFIFDRQDEVLTEISKSVPIVKFNSFDGETVLIDPSIPLFRIGIFSMFGVLVVFILFGLSKEWLVKYFQKKNFIGKTNTLLQATSDHRRELIETFKDIKSMCEQYRDDLEKKTI